MKNNSNKPATSFWIFGILALIWNAIGVFVYLFQAFISNEMKASIPGEQLEILENTPAWATAAFAIAVWFGLIACVFFLMRKKIAVNLFMISFVGIFVQLIYNLFLSKAIEVYGTPSIFQPLIAVGIGFLLIYYSRINSKKGILS